MLKLKIILGVCVVALFYLTLTYPSTDTVRFSFECKRKTYWLTTSVDRYYDLQIRSFGRRLYIDGGKFPKKPTETSKPATINQAEFNSETFYQWLYIGVVLAIGGLTYLHIKDYKP